MACPEVQPAAHRAPKPIRKPPTTIATKPGRVKSASKAKSEVGAYAPSTSTPSAAKSRVVDAATTSGSGSGIRKPATPPPSTRPPNTSRFQPPSRRQS